MTAIHFFNKGISVIIDWIVMFQFPKIYDAEDHLQSTQISTD